MFRNSPRKRSRRPVLEKLERRDVPATWGIAWPDAQHLTVSFMPDGAAVEGQSNQLFRKLDGQLGAGQWESTILNALQTWAENSNINIGQVADGGQAQGTVGPAQGDSRFGDIRISAIPLPAGVAAITSPYDPGTGTVSGDMILNSNDDFSSASGYDLFTVALHEAGHVFGFADSSDPSSFMYNVYGGRQTALGSGAVAALQALYGGPRNIVSADGEVISTSPARSVDITANLSGPNGATPVNGDLAAAQTADYYQFKAPASTATPLGIDLQIQTAGISQLVPRVVVTDSSGNVVASATAPSVASGGVAVHLGSLIPGQVYKIRVDGPTNDLDSIGSYALSIAPTSIFANLTANFSKVTPLGTKSGGTTSSQITGNNQVNFYSFTTPTSVLNGVTVQLQDFGVGLIAPQLAVYNSSGVLMGQAAASNPNNPSASLRLTALLPNTTYYLQVTNGIVNAYDVGIYQASVSYAASSASPATAPILQTPWLGSTNVKLATPNTSLTSAAKLQTPAGYTPGSFYTAMAGSDGTGTAQYYDITVPMMASKGYMDVAVETLGSGNLLPVVSVFNKSGNPVPDQVLAESSGVSVVQVPYSGAGDYIVKVAASAMNGGGTTGNYLLTTTFGTIGSSLGTVSSGTLGAVPAGTSVAGSSASILVPSTQLYEFVLQGDPSNAGSDAMLRLTVTDAAGNVVSTLTCLATEAASINLLLGAGTYSIYVDAYSPSNAAIPPLLYSLSGMNLTDPIRTTYPSGAGSSTTTA